jgi:hypothetical protein
MSPFFLRRFSGAPHAVIDADMIALASGSLEVRYSVVLTAVLTK